MSNHALPRHSSNPKATASRRVGIYLGVKNRPEISFPDFFKSSHDWTSLSRTRHLLCRKRIFFDAHPRSILSLNNADAALRHTRPRQLAQIVDESALVYEDGIAMQDAQEQHNGKAPLANDRWCHCAATMQGAKPTAEKFHWLSGFSNEPVVDAFGHIDSSAVRINERLQYETGYSSYSHGVDGHSIADSEGLTNHNANGSL
ncbi:hypothetical protein ALC53_00057 [Atta colombica]|uniref:Uncharacterized protein n=1 Tax=Atta colombica TaxID=520822 RepID=A0A195BWW5_9HYME|nr:hypothetical protein ALC53_00057 [Atta colombica]